MPQNIELKLKVNDFENILGKLTNSGVTDQTVLNQRDIYYKQPNGLLKLRVFGEKGELIFYQRDESKTDRVSNYKILKLDPVKAEKFFESIFEIEVEVKKKRILLLYKNTRIHLDEVEELGKYVELETVVKNSTANSIEEFNEVVKLLGLDLSDQIKTSYRNLLLAK